MGRFKHRIIFPEIGGVSAPYARHESRGLFRDYVHEEIGSKHDALVEPLRILNELLGEIVDEILLQV